jgi:protein involved in polysaccharide export with SLBB domain
MRAWLVWALGLASVLALSGCAGGGPVTGSAQALRNAQATPYKLGAGDKLHIAVFGENNLSGDYTITAEGAIGFPLAGDIPAAGLTISQLQKSVTDSLATRYVQNPRVTVDALNLRPFYILGEVNKPGQYSYVPDLTAMAAVATAQGFTYRADMSTIYIRRAHDASEREYPLTATTMIEPGDTIRVTQRYF